jgi:hypothetical protein
MTTPLNLRQLTRAGIKIHERLLVPSWIACLDDWPLAQWERLRTLLRRLRSVQSRGWQAAARDVLADIEYESELLVNRLQAFRQELAQSSRQRRASTPGQIAADLAALADEFLSVRIDLQGRTITARTEPIELEGLRLGPFDICLWWERLGTRRPYEVIACQPRRPVRDEQVTHPHVRDHQLCEGDAALPIKAALAEGRLLDFFVLVRQTLETYNGASPYVGLDEWEASRCHDCGSQLEADDASPCEACEEQLCGECTTCCPDCQRYVCSTCTAVCSACEASFCKSCLAGRSGGTSRLCADCRQPQPSEKEPDDHPDDTPPPVLADGLGQAAAAA